MSSKPKTVISGSGSPMSNPALHDTFKFFEVGGSTLGTYILPGGCIVKANLNSNLDEMDVPGGGNQASQLYESTGEFEVDVTIWTSEQWDAYQQILKRLRQGKDTKGKDIGQAVFTSAHPELRARGIKKFYFISESPSGYNPKDGYKVTLKFKERLKTTKSVSSVDEGKVDTILGVSTSATQAGNYTATPTANAKEEAVRQAALRNLVNVPRPSRDGRSNTATPGNCSVWSRWTGVDAGLNPNLFGADAIATEAAFRRAGMTEPWTLNSQKNLRPGQYVFFGNDPSGYGHVGVVTRFDVDGMPIIAGNNLITAKQNGGKDARGEVRLNSLGRPTSVGYPGGKPSGPVLIGPAVPVTLPQNRPSQKVLGPRK